MHLLNSRAFYRITATLLSTFQTIYINFSSFGTINPWAMRIHPTYSIYLFRVLLGFVMLCSNRWNTLHPWKLVLFYFNEDYSLFLRVVRKSMSLWLEMSSDNVYEPNKQSLTTSYHLLWKSHVDGNVYITKTHILYIPGCLGTERTIKV